MAVHGAPWGFHELADRHARALVRGAGIIPPDLVVDVGAGRGAITSHLLATGARVIAVELHPGRAQLLRERFRDDRLTVVQADLEAWRPPTRPYRVVANPPFGRLAALLRVLAGDRHLLQADLVVPAAVAARWSRGNGHQPRRVGAVTVCRLPATAFHPPAPMPTAVLRLVRRA